MTRRDYIAFAAALAASKKASGEARDQWAADVRAIADVLARNNGRFDRGRFYAACGLPT